MYNIGDKIVHPMHGAGVIEDIKEQKINGVKRRYYVLKMSLSSMLIMIPTKTSDHIGVRPIIDAPKADEVMNAFDKIDIDNTINWNQRYRENMLRIKSGDLMQVAKVVKSLIARDKEKGLSTGERKMLNSAKQIFISEIVLAKSMSYEEIENKINKLVV